VSIGARSQFYPKVGFHISTAELLGLNSGEPVNIAKNFTFTDCFTMRME
jgi:hypothetical protein